MKNFNKIVSLVLTLAMLMTVVPFAVSAADTEIYNLDLYSVNLEGVEDIGAAGLLYKATTDSGYTSVRDNGIANAAELGIDPDGAHGTVAKYATTAPNPGEDGNDDNYMLTHYAKGKPGCAAGFYPSLTKVLEKTKVSLDMYLPSDSYGSFNITFYDSFTGGENSLERETLFILSKVVSEDDGTAKPVMYLSANGASDEGREFPLDMWVTLEFCFDFATDTYDVYLNGEIVADNYRLKGLSGGCFVNAFGPRCGEADYAYAMYFDNFRISVNTNNAMPKNTTLVWENDFDSAPAMDAYEAGTGAYVKDMDYRPENCMYKVVQEADGNKYYTFYPSAADKIANSGNEFKSGYFMSDSYSETNHGIDIFPIDKAKFELSLKLDSLFNTQICSYYYGPMGGGNNQAVQFIKFTSEGKILNYKSKEIGTYEAGKWMDIATYVDYQNHNAVVFIDGEFVAAMEFPESITYFNQLRIRTSGKENADVADVSQLGVSVDNIRYSTTYGPEYVQRNSYVSEIGKLDFEELAIDSVIDDKSDMSKYYVMGVGDGVADEPAEPEPPVVVTKPEDYGRVLFTEDHESGVVNTTGCEAQDVSEVKLDDDNGYYVNIASDGSKETNSIYRVRYGAATAPVQASGVAITDLNKVQVSLDVYPTVAFEYPIRFYDKWSTGTTIGENLITLKANGTIVFANSKVTSAYNLGEWMKIDAYLDFDKDVYSVFINGEAAVVDAQLKTLVNCCEAAGIIVGKKTATFGIGVDNFRIAIPGDPIVPDVPVIPEEPDEPEPPAVVTKPADYGRVLFAEDHESGAINKKTCETQDVSEVKLDDDNGYYVNIVSDGSKETNSIYRVLYGTATAPVQASGVAIADLNKMQVSLDVYPTVAFEYPIRFYEKWSTVNPEDGKLKTIGENLLTLKANGTIAFANSKETATYKLGEWMKIDAYLDFDKDVYSIFINGEAAVIDAPLMILVNCCESVGIPVGKKTAEFAIGVDNFRIAIPEATVALAADDTVVYESPYAATIVDDGTGNKVARINAFDSEQSPTATRFGMSADLTRQYKLYKEKGKYPELVKVEARIMKDQGAAYMYLGNQEMVLWSGGHYFQFQTVNAETGKNVRAEATAANYKFKQWVTVAMVMDFGKGTYEAFLDGVPVGEYTIPAGVKTPEKFIIACNSAGDEHVYVDDITVSTLRAYEEPAIIEYYDTAANKKYGYVIENTADTDKSYVIAEAVYNADGTLASLEMTDKSASANSYSFYELDVKEATDGGYIKYFVWDSIDSLKAMFKNIIVE